MIEYIVPPELERKRLDIALAAHQQVSSRSEAARLIREGMVELNDTQEKPVLKTTVYTGDIIRFTPYVPQQLELTPQEYPLEIHYEDDSLLVVYKPRGMVVHPAPGHSDHTLVNYLLHHAQLSSGSDEFRPGIVHRIDKNTSGLLVIAKTNQAHEHLAAQFAEHSIERVYNALVWGKVLKKSGTIDQPLGRHHIDRKKIAVMERGKHAVTHWQLIRQYEYISHLECRLETGRTHQIRVHLSWEGFPIVGDLVYGRKRKLGNRVQPALKTILEQTDGQMLHAAKIGFEHPVTGDLISFHREIPEEMNRIIELSENKE